MRSPFFAVVLILAVASGCSDDKKAPASGKVSVVIGSVAPLTGGIAHLGKDNENGARLAIEEANAAGAKIGGKDVQFDLISLDDQADPKVGTTVAQKLVDTKVAGVVGH
ncbi:MAG TPA: ABC transporter substrate-binding protein, partial [Burkholderiales bacterium]|nr:ABC transporter substrate-binding protein [Burkholderiales bacterium]